MALDIVTCQTQKKPHTFTLVGAYEAVQLTLLRKSNMNSLSLSFNQVNLNPVDQKDGQIWLTSADLAMALGYKNQRSINKLYNSNSDEFTNFMTQIIEITDSVTSSKTKGLTAKIRIFSLRGCHLLAMFARTKVAKDFRIWVLDILDRQVKTSPDQRTPLRRACDRLAVGNMLVSDAYKIVCNNYGVEHIDQIPETYLPEAVAYVYELVLKLKTKDVQDYQTSLRLLGQSKVEEINHAVKVAEKHLCSLEHAMRSLDCALTVIKERNATNGSVFQELKAVEVARLR